MTELPMNASTVVVPYDPTWPDIFDEEMEQVTGVVGHIIRRIVHVGSTAVPGLASKPILDILVGVADADSAELCLKPLARIGYTQVTPRTDKGDSWYYSLSKYARGGPGYEIQMMEFPSTLWEDHLLFRNHLRGHPAVAREYERLKQKLAAGPGNEDPANADAKAEFIGKIIKRARREKKSKERRTL
jgi:GrpB-like predicted nucleotidyltransferase (UPF0157 family)